MSAQDNLSQQLFLHPIEILKNYIVDGHHRLAVARGSNRLVPVTFKK